jgi:hypothetical protein
MHYHINIVGQELDGDVVYNIINAKYSFNVLSRAFLILCKNYFF